MFYRQWTKRTLSCLFFIYSESIAKPSYSFCLSRLNSPLPFSSLWDFFQQNTWKCAFLSCWKSHNSNCKTISVGWFSGFNWKYFGCCLQSECLSLVYLNFFLLVLFLSFKVYAYLYTAINNCACNCSITNITQMSAVICCILF